MSNQTVARTTAPRIETLLDQPGIKGRFNQMLGTRAPQFISSLIQVYKGFSQDVEPTSVIASAAIAASLDLPIEKSLGFAHIVPYAGIATFQMGYKGYIQLALRSGQYAGMNAVALNAECFGGYDVIGDPIIHWDKWDDTKPAIGYVFAWKLVTGFHKTVFWTKEKVLDHAQKYSQAYRKKKADSAWITGFDGMALKTVISNALRRWGILSVQMQTALRFDQMAVKSIDGEPIATDDIPFGEASESKLLPAKKKAGKKDSAEPTQSGGTVDVQTETTPATAASESSSHPTEGDGPGVIPLEHGDGEDPTALIRIIMTNASDHDITEASIMQWAAVAKMATPKQKQLSDLATHKLRSICEQWPTVVKEING